MDPREELYKALQEKLEQVDGVKHVDLWNENTTYLEDESPWPRPAVFIEMRPIEWTVLKDSFRGRGEIRLHTVIDWSSDAPITAWRLTDKIWHALEQIDGETFGGCYPSMTIPNESHMEVFENVDVFQAKYLKPWPTS